MPHQGAMHLRLSEKLHATWIEKQKKTLAQWLAIQKKFRKF
jgi:hypothetical protein